MNRHVVVPAKAGTHDHRQAIHGTIGVHGFPLARERRARPPLAPRLAALSLAVTLGWLALGPSAALAQAPLTKVRVAYDGFSMTSAPLIYADKHGLFRQFGLDVTPTFVEGGSTLTQAVVGGSVDIAQNGYTPAAAAAAQGADIVFIGGISNKLPFQLVVKSSIARADELKGQAIAISRYGSSTDQAADFALRHLGLTRDDVKVLQLGGPTTRIAAAMSGRIAGTMEQYPDTAALSRRGFHVLVDVTDVAADYPNTSYVTSRAYLAKNRDAVKRFLMAMATAVREYKRNADEAIKITQGFLKIDEADDAKAAYQAYVKVYPDDLRPSLKGLALVLHELAAKEPKAASLKPEQLTDTSVLDELDRDGFFHKLAASH
jgi:NitT/TauT family transport system substrate-binding protein